MRCNVCNIDLADTARFCNLCGASLVSFSQQDTLVKNGSASPQGVGMPPLGQGVGATAAGQGVGMPPLGQGVGATAAGLFSDLDWRGVQYGAGALAIALTLAFHTQMKSIMEQAHNTGSQPDLSSWYIVSLALSAIAGMVDIHYSRTRLPKEAAVAAALGMVGAVLLVAMMNPTVNTIQGPFRLFRFDFALLLRDTLGSIIAGGFGGYWYADWLRKQGR